MMFKHPVYLFASPDGAPTLAGTRWGLGALVVLARHLCVHFALDVRGVPLRRTASFVQINAPRLAPFAEPDGTYLRQGDTVHVWVWPQALSTRVRVAGGAEATLVPESLLGPAPMQGAVLRPCVVGFGALRFENAQLVDDAWWPREPDADEQSRWSKSAGVTIDARTSTDRATAATLWSRAARPLPGPGSLTRSASASRLAVPPRAWLLAGWGVLALSLGYLGWSYGESRQLANAATRAQGALDRAVARGRPRGVLPAVEVREPGSADERFVQRARSASRSVDIRQAWAGLAPRLASEGLLVREFQFDRGDLKLTLVSGYGTEVDIAAAVTAVESTGAWRQVELVDISNPLAVRLSAKPRDGLFRSAS